jgi:hypothetical protein
MEERKPMYFRKGGTSVKQFYAMNEDQRKEHILYLLCLEDKLDFNDEYLLNFYGPKKEVKTIKFISMDVDQI